MNLFIIFLGIVIVFFLFQKSKINRIQRQEYLKSRKAEQVEKLMELARKQDAMKASEIEINTSLDSSSKIQEND